MKVPIETGFSALVLKFKSKVQVFVWLKICKFSETKSISNYPKKKKKKGEIRSSRKTTHLKLNLLYIRNLNQTFR